MEFSTAGERRFERGKKERSRRVIIEYNERERKKKKERERERDGGNVYVTIRFVILIKLERLIGSACYGTKKKGKPSLTRAKLIMNIKSPLYGQK